MIEFPITLTSGGSVCLPGHAFALALGYTKNRGVYRLAVTASGEWEGLAIRAFWHVPDGKDPASSLVEDGYVAVPASVTAQPGNGCITFEGSDGAKVMTSADLRYRVSANSGTEDGTEPEPGTPAWQQLVDAVHADATAAEQAKTDAQTAAQQSEASAKKSGKALSDTITAKEDALKAIGDKQTTATQAVDTARDKALKQVKASTEAAQTAASEAATSAGNADQSAQKAADSLQALKDGIAAGDFKGEPGNDGKSPIVTVTDIENGHRVSITDKDGTKTIDVLNGQTGETGATPVLTIGTVSSGDKPSADITGTPENPVLNLRLQPGPQGPAVALDTTLTHEGEAADAKVTGDAISAVKARQNVLAGSEIGNPISVDDAFPAPLCGLTVYGRSTQDGTPTPDAPVPIVSAGDGGSVAVKVTGKNLYHAAWTGNYSENGLLLTATSTTVAIKGTAMKDAYITQWLVLRNNPIPLDPNKRYTFTPKLAGNTFEGLMLYTYDEKGVGTYTGSNIPARSTGVSVYYQKKFKKDETIDFEASIQLEIGTEATVYEPYREQLLTLLTPNGLPGIPVASGGNYTDSTGQQWVCDEVDLTRGVRVQRIASFVINAENASNFFVTNDSTAITVAANARLATPQKTKRDDRQYGRCVFCEALPWNIYAWAIPVNAIGFVEDNSVDLTIENSYLGLSEASTNAERKTALVKYFTDNPCHVVYRIATPIETSLTPAELSAYKALIAYAPDTVVQAGDGAGIKLDYQRDVNLVIKNLEDAIASMT